MKILKKASLILLLFASQASAQSLYFNAALGYGEINNPMLFTTSGGSFKAYSYTATMGVPVYLQKINVELQYTSISSGFSSQGDHPIGELSVSRALFIPSVKISLGQTKYSVYGKFGIIIALKGMVEQDKIYSSFDTIITPLNYKHPEINYTKAISQGSAGYGFNCAMGYNYRIIDAMSVFAEVNYMGISWSPTHSEVVQSTGRDLSNFTIAEKQTDYAKFASIYYNPDQPMRKAIINNYFQFAGISLGVNFYIGRAR